MMIKEYQMKIILKLRLNYQTYETIKTNQYSKILIIIKNQSPKILFYLDDIQFFH